MKSVCARPVGRAAAACLIALACITQPSFARQESLEPEDYARFESPGAGVLSPDGRWFAYVVNRVNEVNELRVRALARDTPIVIPYGGSQAFSADSRWLAYSVGVSPTERERLTAEDRPVRVRAGLLDLRTGARTDLGEAESFEFSADGRYIAIRAYAQEGARTADLIIRDPASGTNVHFGNVSGFAWSPEAAMAAVIVETGTGAGTAVQLYDATSGALRVLDSSGSLYRGLAWRDESRDLAVLRTVPDTLFRDTAHTVIAWRRLGNTDATRHELDPARAPGFPDRMRIAESHTPRWTDDGAVITLGLRPRTPRQARDPLAADTAVVRSAREKPSDVQVWHARDVRIIPQQRAQEQQDLRRTLLSAWHVDDERIVQVGTDLYENASLLAGGRYAFETDRSRNTFGTMFGRSGHDVWLIDVQTGERSRILEDVETFFGGSATGRYLLWFDGTDHWTYDVETGRRANLTETLDARFANEQHDFPVDRLPSYGIAGWLRGDSAVLVYDRYDVWRLAPDGSAARRLTTGMLDRVIHRLVVDDAARDDGIDASRPLYLALNGERTKQTGWARLRDGSVERLLLEDARLGRLTRADSADVFAFTRERFDDPPDWFVGDAALRTARQISNLNPFRTDFAWGRAQLLDFTSEGGLELQAALLYPAGYEPGRRYPMIVYTYELLSQNVHDYVVPSERSYYNFTVFTTQGYFVLLPDIVYRGRDPGVSAIEAVRPAVQAVVERGLVDPDRIGLIGHSWGGYQATYLPTRTDLFAAAVAGAPITNFLSFPGAIHWTPGIPEFSHWETGQARMGVPFWEDMEAYLRNSPAHRVHELETPMLMMFGDADGVVDWHQGVEFYNFARRAGREDFVLLVYPGEDHGLRKRENQIDYHRRILQWFGHWLKGEPPARWITDGTSWQERKDVLDNGR